MRKLVLFSVTCVTLLMLALGTYSASTSQLANGNPPPELEPPGLLANGNPPPELEPPSGVFFV